MNKNEILETLKSEFILRYGKADNKISLTLAPARVNIIGEHIDYNGGLVFPAAINLYLAIALRKRSDKKIIYQTTAQNKTYEFSVDGNFQFKKENDFANYLNGVLKYLMEKKLNLNCGFELLISSNIPEGSGLSSSAALELCLAQALCSNFGLQIEKIELAKLGMRVENEFLNLHSGIMDQAIIALGQKDKAILLDTANLKYEYIPLKTEPFVIAVMNSNKPRKLTESKYNERKAECDKALKFFKDRMELNFLCNLSVEDYEAFKPELTEKFGEAVCKRVIHCITEMERVKLSVEALKNNDIEKLGKLLYQSHLSLKEDYEVTGKELDSLVFNAVKHPSCVGARMTGAGFSGCAIALVHKDGFKDFADFVGKNYQEETDLQASFFPCLATDGVKTL